MPENEPLRDWIVTFAHRVAEQRAHIASHPGATFVVMLNRDEAEGLLTQLEELVVMPPRVSVKGLEHDASCAIFFGSVSCNCGAVMAAIKANPGGNA